MGILVRSIKEIKKVEIDDKKTFLIFDKDKLYFEGIFMIMNKEIDYNSLYLNIRELNSLVKLNCSTERLKNLKCKVEFKTDERPISTIILIKEKQDDKLYDISERKSLSVVYYPQVKYIFPNTFSINKQNNISIITDIIANNTLAKFSFNCDIIDSFSNDTLIKGVIIYQNDNIFICHFSPLDIYHNIKLKVSLIYKDKYININLIDIYPVINDDIVDHYPKVYVNNKNDEINFVFSRLNKSVLFFHRKTIEKKILLTLSEWKNDYSVIVNGDYYSFYEDDFVISNRIGDVLKKYFSSKNKIRIKAYVFYLNTVNDYYSKYSFNIKNYYTLFESSYQSEILFFYNDIKFNSPSPQYSLLSNTYNNITIYDTSNINYQKIKKVFDILTDNNINIYCRETFSSFSSISTCNNNITINSSLISIYLYNDIHIKSESQLEIFIEGYEITSIVIQHIDTPFISYISPRTFIVNQLKTFSIDVYGINIHFDPMSIYSNKTHCHIQNNNLIDIKTYDIRIHSNYHFECIFENSLDRLENANALFSVEYEYNSNHIEYIVDNDNNEIVFYYIEIFNIKPSMLSLYSDNTISLSIKKEFDITIDFLYDNMPLNYIVKQNDILNVYTITKFTFKSIKDTIYIDIVMNKGQYRQKITFDIIKRGIDIYIDSYYIYSSRSIMLIGNFDYITEKLSCVINQTNKGVLQKLYQGMYLCSCENEIILEENNQIDIVTDYFSIPFSLHNYNNNEELLSYENIKRKEEYDIQCNQIYYKLIKGNITLFYNTTIDIISNIDIKICYDDIENNCEYIAKEKLNITTIPTESISLTRAQNFTNSIYVMTYINKANKCNHTISSNKRTIDVIYDITMSYIKMKQKIYDAIISYHTRYKNENITHISYIKYDYKTSEIYLAVDYDKTLFDFINDENITMFCVLNGNKRSFAFYFDDHVIKCKFDIEHIMIDNFVYIELLTLNSITYTISKQISLPIVKEKNKSSYLLYKTLFYCDSDTVIDINILNADKDKEIYCYIQNEYIKAIYITPLLYQCPLTCKESTKTNFELKYKDEFNSYITIRNSNNYTVTSITFKQTKFHVENYWPKQIFFDNETFISDITTPLSLYLLSNAFSDVHAIYKDRQYECNYDQMSQLCLFRIDIHNIEKNNKNCIYDININIISDDDSEVISISAIPFNDIETILYENSSVIFQSRYDINEENIYCGVSISRYAKIERSDIMNGVYQCALVNLFNYDYVNIYTKIEVNDMMIQLMKFPIKRNELSSLKKNVTKGKYCDDKSQIVLHDVLYEDSNKVKIKGSNIKSKEIEFYIDDSEGECEVVNDITIECSNIPKNDNKSSLVRQMRISFIEQSQSRNIYLIDVNNINNVIDIISETIFSYSQKENVLIFNLTDNSTLIFLSSIHIKIDHSLYKCQYESSLLFCDISSYFNSIRNSIGKYQISFVFSDHIEALYTKLNITMISYDISESDIIKITHITNDNHKISIRDNEIFNLKENHNKMKMRFKRSKDTIERYVISNDINDKIVIDIDYDIPVNDDIVISYNDIDIKVIYITKIENENEHSNICDINHIYTLMRNKTYNYAISHSNFFNYEEYLMRQWISSESLSTQFPLITLTSSFYSIPNIKLISNISTFPSNEYFNVSFISLYQGTDEIYYNDIICYIFNSKYLYYYSSPSHNNTCYNLHCDTSIDDFFYLEIKYKDILLLKKQFKCEVKSYSLTDINSNHIPFHFFHLYHNDSYVINALQSNINKTSLLKDKYPFESITKEHKYNHNDYVNESFIDEDIVDINYECNNRYYDVDFSSYNYYTFRYISSISHSNLPNFFYNDDDLQIVTATVNGYAFCAHEIIAVNIVNADHSISIVTKANITSLDKKHSMFTISFYLSSNINLHGSFFILVSQFDTSFSSISSNDIEVNFINVPYISSISSKLLRYDGSEVNFQMSNFDDVSIDDLQCGWFYGISTIVYTPITRSDSHFQCESPDLTFTTMKMKKIEMKVTSKVNSILSSNKIIYNLYYSDAEHVVNVYPMYYRKGTLLKMKINFDDINRNVYDTSYHNIKCKFDNEEVTAKFDVHNKTIICDIDTIVDFSTFANVNVFYSYNEGVNWENTMTSVVFYDDPTITDVSYVYDGKYMITIKGNNFINANNDLRCLFLNANGIDLNIKAVFISETEIKCEFIALYEKEQNDYAIYLTYNSGEEIIDTKFTLSYKTPPMLKNINPNKEINNFQHDIAITTTYTDIIYDKSKCFAFALKFILDSAYKCIDIDGSGEMFIYTPLEISYNDIDYSNSKLSYYKIDIKYNEFVPLLGPITGNTIISIKGENFMLNPNFKFDIDGSIVVPSYANSTMISLTTPPVSSSKTIDIKYTINDVYYHNLGISYVYYEEIEIIDISPKYAYSEDTTVVFIEAKNMINNPFLVCKADDYVIQCEYIIIDTNKEYCKCTLPPFEYIKHGIINPTESDLSITISLSNNNQNFSPSTTSFLYHYHDEEVEQSLRYSPKNGPESGNTLITFTSDNFKSNLTVPLCYFGDVLVNGLIILDRKAIECVSPPLASISQREIDYSGRDLYFAYVKLMLVYEERKMLFSYVYNVNITLRDYFPNNVEIGKEIEVNVIGGSFYYYSLLRCKYENNDGSIVAITKGKSDNFGNFVCPVPIISAITTYTEMTLTFTLNNVDYYTSLSMKMYYRYPEKIVSALPSLLPISPTLGHFNIITLTMTYYFDQVYKKSFCLLSNTDDPSTATFRISFNTKIGANSNEVSCQLPNLKNIKLGNLVTNGGDLYIGASSNGINYVTPLSKITFYVNPIINSLSKTLFPTMHVFHFDINGNHFRRDVTGYVIIKCNANTISQMFIADYISSSQLSVSNVDLSQCSPESDNGNIDIKLTYDNTNFFSFVGKTFCYSDHIINSVFPLIVVKGVTKRITFVIDDNIYLHKAYGCIIKDSVGNLIGYGTVIIQSNTILICEDINLLTFPNGNIRAKIALLGNNEDYIINDDIDIYVIDIETLNLSGNSIINTYALNKDTINIAGSGFDMTIKYYIKIDTFILEEKEHNDENNLKFERESSLYKDSYNVMISSNLNDWKDTNIDIVLNALYSCEEGKQCIDNTNKGIYFHSEVSTCEKGNFCVDGITMKCPVGTYSNSLNSLSCTECPIGTVCFNIGISIPESCPLGYQCTVKGTFSHYQLKPCPEGYYCDSTTNDFTISNGLINTAGHVKSCPLGFYCAIATYTPFYEYNVYGHPQLCLEGVICGQNLDGNVDNSMTNGNDNQYGLRTCPIGKFCYAGRGFPCSQGTECNEEDLSFPMLCIPGMYYKDSGNECQLCPIGSYCPTDGTIEPYYCKPGRVCEFTGQHRPSDYCPVGFYCTDSSIGFPTDKESHTDITKKYYPKNCLDGQLCLSGIATDVTDENNPEAPQPCRPGMVCKGGTDSGSTLCPAGYYCPGSINPIPAPAGSYVPGEGFVSPLECAPGYYTDIEGQTECFKCPAGKYTYLQGQTQCSNCEKGSYRSDDMSSINCALCPSGTYNENEGSASLAECVNCPKGYLCDIEGMSDFANQARICPQGYICDEGTNLDNIQMCPEGFFCSEGTSEMYQLHICLEGYYCDKGSTPTNNKKNPCTAGWFCPYGSYYDSTTESILQSSLISYVMQQKQIYSPTDTDIINYLTICDENLDIPSEYLQSYSSLKCPTGTKSPSGSKCIGQCVKDESTPAEVIDPVRPEDYDSTSSSRRNLDSVDQYISMEPFELIYLSFDFSPIPSYLVFLKHYSISISNSVSEQSLPSYITSSDFVMPSSKKLQFKIFNYNHIVQHVIIRINLHNGLYLSLSNLFLLTASIKRYIPYRSNIGTNNLFTFFVMQSTFISNSISLPYNFYDNDKQTASTPLSIGYYPTEANFTYDHGYSEKDPYLVQLFEDNSITGSFMPWIPFLSNCEGYDDKIILFDLLENSDSCIFPSTDSIVIVHSFPSNGLTAISDTCKISLTCRYDEINQSVISNKWFSITSEKTLAYISSEAITIGNVTNTKANEIVDDFKSYQKQFIPVSFIPYRKGVTNLNCFPQDIVIDIQYYQYDLNNKKIVDFVVQMYNYTQCVNSLAEGTQNISPYYNVKINYYPLDYFELLNYFQFSYLSYFLLIFAIGWIIVFIILLFWIISNIVTKIKEAQSLKILNFIQFFFYPFFKGVIMSDILVASLTALNYGIEASKSFLHYPSTWYGVDSGGFDTDDEALKANVARTSVYFVLAGFVIFKQALDKMIPLPPRKDQVEQEKKKLLENQSEINRQLSKDLDDLSQDNDNASENNEERDTIDQDVEMHIVLDWKQKTMIIKILFCMMYMVFKTEYIVSNIYRNNVIVYIVTLNIVDQIVDELFLKFIFSEALIASPLLCVSKVIKFLLLVGANNFKESLVCYIIVLVFNTLIRIFITPIIDQLEYLSNKKFEALLIEKGRNNCIFKYLHDVLYRKKNEGLEEDLDAEIKKIQYLNHKNKSTIEPILRSMLVFSTNITALVIIPHCLIIMYIFDEEMQSFLSFDIKSGNLVYYIIFSLATILPEMLIEMILTNYTETMHGFRIQEYIGYCRYRYSTRNSGWIIMKHTMDTSINSFWRSLDSLLFSEQYYYLLYYASMSLVFLVLAFEIALNHQYNPFGEPMLAIFVLVFIAVYIGISLVFKFLEYFGGLFSYKKFKLNPREGQFLEFVKVDSKIKDITKFMTTELFRQKFITVNKNWIIDNLEFVLGFDKLDKEINDTNEKVEAKLQRLYQEAVNYEAIDQEIQNKKALIKRDLQVLPYNQKGEGEINDEFGIRLDISKDSIIDEPIGKIGKVNMKSVNKPYTKLIAVIWRNKAREIIRFKTWSIEVLEEAKMEYCEKCNSTFNLHVFQDIPFVQLVNEFKKENNGIKMMMANWQKFYAKKQTFITLCMECAYLRNTKIITKQNEENEKVIISKKNDEKIREDLSKPNVKGMLLMWLFEARSKILIDRMDKRNKKKKTQDYHY